MEERLKKEGPKVLDSVISRAHAGDAESARCLLSYCIHKPTPGEKPLSQPIDVGELKTPEEIAAARRQLVAQVAAGEIGLGESETISRLMDSLGNDHLLAGLQGLDSRLEAARAEARERAEAMASLQASIKANWAASDAQGDRGGYADERPEAPPEE